MMSNDIEITFSTDATFIWPVGLEYQDTEMLNSLACLYNWAHQAIVAELSNRQSPDVREKLQDWSRVLEASNLDTIVSEAPTAKLPKDLGYINTITGLLGPSYSSFLYKHPGKNKLLRLPDICKGYIIDQLVKKKSGVQVLTEQRKFYALQSRSCLSSCRHQP